MVELESVISYCHERLSIDSITDFENAQNGLQLENNGIVTKIAASVDAGLIPLQQASQVNADFLLCHHGLFWSPITPIRDHNYKKIKLAMDHNIAVFSAHLPLDCHPEIGNNALLAKALELEVVDTFLEYKGTKYSFICQSNGCTRSMLTERLKALFPNTFSSILYGSETTERIAVLSGSGQSAVPYLKANNIDTLITGELKQHHFNMAQEVGLNLYPCGHYATETFGVKGLAEELANHFKIEWTFLEQDCLI